MISSVQAYSTLKDVLTCPLKTPPNAGSSWEGVQHGELIKLLIKQFEIRRMTPLEQRYDLSRDGADLAASWQLSNYPTWTRGINAAFGLVTSNARRRALHFFAGAVEESTSTPVVFAMTPGWKYVKGVDRESECAKAVEVWLEHIQECGYKIMKMKHNPLSRRDVDLLLMTTGRKKILPWSRVGQVDWAWRQGNDPTEWGLMKAFWTAASISPAQDQMGQVLMFSNLVFAGVKGLVKEAV